MLFSKTSKKIFAINKFMLPESRLYSFIDQNEGFTLNFLEGQKLIQELAVIHSVIGEGFRYFRDAILSFQQMITYLKSGEGLGIYIDSNEPYFKLKLEMSDQGQMRTLLLPEDFNQFPKEITGSCRVVKLHPGDSQPYTSIIKLVNSDFHSTVNQVLTQSYQVRSQIFLSEDSDQSVMLTKLPKVHIDKEEFTESIPLPTYWNRIKDAVNEIFARGLTDEVEIIKSIESLGLLYIGSKEVKFQCSCSKERMLSGIKSIANSAGIGHVFGVDEDFIETKCDYCKLNYIIYREEV